eukprot:TRINITY_DN4543_c0_g1_i7.p1 TRINITY_DN4543_c0_g1~~TRINITY_DN4543_c0_g1_i7.p1  ORF type:complete len:273 (-),score=54.29 TRINITY_DN4543_c0_g1_i7:57-875(-)
MLGCCTQADRGDFMTELIARGCPFYDLLLCSECHRPRDWCGCSVKHNGISPLALCCINDHSRTATALLQAGANMNLGTTVGPDTLLPIHLCAVHGSSYTITALCRQFPGVASYATPNTLLTPLMLAVQNQRECAVEVLLAQSSTCPTACSADGRSVMEFATEDCSDRIIAVLVHAGAPQNQLSKRRMAAARRCEQQRRMQERALSSIAVTSTPRSHISISGLLTPRDVLSTPRDSGQLTSRVMLPPVTLVQHGAAQSSSDESSLTDLSLIHI